MRSSINQVASESLNMEEAQEKLKVSVEDIFKELEATDMEGATEELEMSKETYSESVCRSEDPPTRLEIGGWYLHGLCTHFVQTVVVPIILPLIISQSVSPSPTPSMRTSRGVVCAKTEMVLYQELVNDSITVHSANFSPLDWTTIAWAASVLLSFPILTQTSNHLLVYVVTLMGPLFCLFTGFFRKTWLFPLYIVSINLSSIIGSSSHAKFLSLMVHRLSSNQLFPNRVAATSWFCLSITAVSSAGSLIFAAFTYHMVGHKDKLTSLWVVFIYSGIAWLVGLSHIFISTSRRNAPSHSSTCALMLSVFKYPHAIGGFASMFLSSFASMCMFTGVVLFVIGGLCITHMSLLALWLVYFTFPVLSLPLLHPLVTLFSFDAVRMQLLGLFMTAVASGMGFYFGEKQWHVVHILLVALLQSSATGILNAFGQGLITDCTPKGKEGAFSAWFAWLRAAGMCAGFAVAAVYANDVQTTFGLSFSAVVLASLVLIFGKVSHLGGAMTAGNVGEELSTEESALPSKQI